MKRQSRRTVAGFPARGEIQDRVVEPHPAVLIATDRVDMRAEMQWPDDQAGFLQQFPPRRLLAGLTKILGAARQGPTAHGGRLGAAAQQHMVALDHDDPDANKGPGRIFAVAHGFGASGGEAGAASRRAELPSRRR